MSEDLRVFEHGLAEPLGAYAFVAGTTKHLDLYGQERRFGSTVAQIEGLFQIPEGLSREVFDFSREIPKGANKVVVGQLKLGLVVSPTHRIVFLEKDIAADVGPYRDKVVYKGRSFEGCSRFITRQPIDVLRDVMGNFSTDWNSKNPNRVDGVQIGPRGEFKLFHPGFLTRTNGKNFQLHGEMRCVGQLFRLGDSYVVKPAHPRWGSFKKKEGMFKVPSFKELAETADLPLWDGSDEDLYPAIEAPSTEGLARVEFGTPFMGHNGQWLAILHDGTSAWVHGEHIQESPDEDGIKRLWCGELIRYEDIRDMKPGKPPKLVGVKRAK